MSLIHPAPASLLSTGTFAPATAPVIAARLRLRAFQRHMALWTLQGWLAMFFGGAAYAKLTSTLDILTVLLGWPEYAGLGLVRAVGACELTLAVGVLAPLLTWRLAPIMSTSAMGLFGLSGFNLALHLSRLELGFAGLNLLIAAAALAILIGRRRWPPHRA